MKHCKNLNDLSFDEGVSVAIRHSPPGLQFHIGVLCKEGDESYIIHLRDHYELTKTENTAIYNYIKINQFNELDLVHMLTYMKTIYSENSIATIPFGPCGGGEIGENGVYSGEIGDGLTCSSFVLEALESQGYTLIDRHNWPNRAEDSEWQMEMIANKSSEFNYDSDDISHFDQQKEKIGALRFRPNEVAASATFSCYENNFSKIEPVAIEIEMELTNNK